MNSEYQEKAIAIIAINQAGVKLASKLKSSFKNARIFQARMDNNGTLKGLIKTIFHEYEGLIFIGAVGIAVRLISPLIKSKLSDPAVVSVDSAGRFAISLLCGHEGGANKLTFLVAASLDAIPVITTGHEAHKKFIIGLGTRKGINTTQVEQAIRHSLNKNRIALEDVRLAATIGLKKNEEGLLKACASLNLPLVFIPKESIRNIKEGISQSKVVKRHIGVDGVCEPCALLAGRRTRLIAKKTILDGVTVAIAEEN
ncbi:MAG: cobalamin biosynthesis protein [Candidatus Omnitrophica bacterium]|nr:cobalamin biosynthesis protein [Candidatus Omnitrophota bacterium]